MKLLLNALIKFMAGFLLVGAMLFIPAGTLKYTNAWIFLGLLFIPIFILGIVLFIKAPNLLQKRLDGKENEKTQKGVVALSGLCFFGGFIVAGLDYRFSWTHIPTWGVILGSIVLLVSYTLYAEVMRENTYLSRTIKVVEGQKVVSTGLYGIVRHPMYFATILLFMSMPLVLGSLVSFVVFLAYPIIIAKRIKNEEEVLLRELDGYSEYRQKVKYRMIPCIW